MNSAITSPEPNQGEPHPAVRLAEAVCALIAAIAGPSWFWRFLPGGRAFWAQMHRMGQDFAALMHRLAAAPPAPPIIALRPPKRSRQSQRTAELRPRHAPRAPRPRRASVPTRPAPRPRSARPIPTHAPIPADIGQVAQFIMTLRERRRQKGLRVTPPNHALFITIQQ